MIRANRFARIALRIAGATKRQSAKKCAKPHFLCKNVRKECSFVRFLVLFLGWRSGYPTGKTGVWGDRTVFYVPKFYVPFLLPSLLFESGRPAKGFGKGILVRKCHKVCFHLATLCDTSRQFMTLFRKRLIRLDQARKKEPKPKLLSPDICCLGRGLPREGAGAKKFGMSLETREIKLFGRDIPGFCWDIPAVPEKFEKKKFVFNFWPLLDSRYLVHRLSGTKKLRFI